MSTYAHLFYVCLFCLVFSVRGKEWIVVQSENFLVFSTAINKSPTMICEDNKLRWFSAANGDCVQVKFIEAVCGI